MRRVLSLLIGLLLVGSTVVAQQAPVEFDAREAWLHLMSERPVIHATLAPAEQERFGIFEGIEVKLVVGINGEVLSAEATGGAARLRPQAQQLVRALHFRPFERNGVPVRATTKIGVAIFPPEKIPARHVPFPTVKNWQSLRMRLSRSVCFGTCADYSVEVHGDGTVVYNGGRFVAVEGTHRSVIAKSAVGDLLNAFRAADFFSLDPAYRAGITDNPTYTVCIEFDGHKKDVEDYVGRAVGMPDAVTRVEDLLDRLTDSERWVKGNSNTVPSLAAEHWDFKSADATATLTRLAQNGKTDVVREMLAAGTSPNSAPEAEQDKNQRVYHRMGSALSSAAARGDMRMLGALLDAGADVNEGKAWSPALAVAAQNARLEAARALLDHGAAANAETLVSAAGSGSAEMVKLILALHIDPNAQLEDGITPLFNCAASSLSGKKDEKLSNVEVARVLLDAGADPNARTAIGETPLMKTNDAELAELLLANGADVNAKDSQGETALLKTYSAAVTRVLLAHGADPTARDKSGKTALERAKQFNDKEMIAAINKALSGAVK